MIILEDPSWQESKPKDKLMLEGQLSILPSWAGWFGVCAGHRVRMRPQGSGDGRGGSSLQLFPLMSLCWGLHGGHLPCFRLPVWTSALECWWGSTARRGPGQSQPHGDSLAAGTRLTVGRAWAAGTI